MSSKVKRKVTVENSKDSGDQPRRPSVFERLGPGAVNVPSSSSQSQDRHSRVDHNEKCRNWLRTGSCSYGSTCRYQHDLYPNNSSSSSSKRSQKNEKEAIEKDLRHKVRKQRDEPESRTGSLSPKRKGGKRSGSRSRRGEHESKIKSTVVVTRPRSPAPSGTAAAEPTEEKKKKAEGSWEDDSDDWPMDAAQLDYKEELTLERKRQQLQRELELEIQKERMENENVTITKTVSFSESSSTTSSSDSGSVSSSSESSSSSSDDDSDESSSSSSSSSSSASRTSKKKYKKTVTKKETAPSKKSDFSSRKKPLDDYDKIKSKINAKRSSPEPSKRRRRSKDRRASPSPGSSPRRRGASDAKGTSRTVRRGPRTPSPLPSGRKERLWAQSSSADSRAGETKRSKGKRHKKKKEPLRSDSHKYDNVPVPPRLSSPNRTAIPQHGSAGKKSWQKDDGSRSRHRSRDHSPLLLPKYSSASNSPGHRHGSGYAAESDKHARKRSRSNQRGRKSNDNLPHSYKIDNREHSSSKHSRLSPVKDSRQASVSPHRDKYDSESFPRKVYSSPLPSADKSERNRRGSPSPTRHSKDHRKKEVDKRRDARDVSPRSHDGRRDGRYQSGDVHGYEKRDEPKVKRLLSPDVKKRDDKKDRGAKDRDDHDAWISEHKKTSVRPPEPRGHPDPPSPLLSITTQRSDRGRERERERERKKGKERDLPPLRDDKERERQRLSPPPPPVRKGQEIHPHHTIRADAPIPVPRGRIFEAELPPDERDYAYAYPPHREPPYIDERALPPEFEPDLLHHGPPLYPPPEAADYPPPVFADPLYRRDVLKEPAHIERIAGYVPRDVSPLDPREPVVLPRELREEDYLDLPIDERRAYDERWGRGRPLRDEWDPFAGLPPPGLPPHVATGLDEDRYGMPRRRRASPDWHLHRADERDLPLRERRSRSPQHRRSDEPPVSGRGPWRDDRAPDRHVTRNSDPRAENLQKNQDDRKGRNYRRDRRDHGKKPDVPAVEPKPKEPAKEKPSQKRPHSPSPARKDAKRKKEEPSTDAAATSDKSSSSKKSREETKADSRTSSSSRKPAKPETAPAKSEQPPAKSTEKKENFEKVVKNATKSEVDEKKKRSSGDNRSQVDDDFSDWSDGDDDLLNRDLNEMESATEKSQAKADDQKRDRKQTDVPGGTSDSRELRERSSSSSSKRKRDGSRDSRTRTSELKLESRSRPGSRERPQADSTEPGKLESANQSSKESELSEGYVVKDEAVGEPDDFVTTESVDYDPISDDELEAMIEEPNDSVTKASEDNEGTKIVDALDVNWSVLMSDSKPEFVPGNARKRFRTAHVLTRIGFSQSLAGPELSEKLRKFCQTQLDEEEEEKEDKGSEPTEKRKFQMEHHIAAFHAALVERKKERESIFSCVGPARRALCARQDLHIRKLLCRPSYKLTLSASCVQQHADSKDQKMKVLESQAAVVNAAC